MTKRIKREALHIQTARLYSLRGTCSRLQVGAVAVREGRIIATGYNGPLANEPHCSPEVCDTDCSCVRSIHAEANLITFCAKEGIALKGADLYVTHSPCIKCAELIIASGLTRVYFLDYFRSSEGIEKLLTTHVQVIHILEDGEQTYL